MKSGNPMIEYPESMHQSGIIKVNYILHTYQDYLDFKEQYLDTILFYRVGDFYELFFNDALVGSKELEIVLTGKDAGVE